MDNQKMGYLLVVIGVLAAFAITQASTASLPGDDKNYLINFVMTGHAHLF